MEEIREHLDEKEETRDDLLKISRRAVRNSSGAMSALHNGRKEKVSKKLRKVEKDIKKLNEILDSEPRFSSHGSLISAHREYVEVLITESFIEDETPSSPQAVGVLDEAYAQALPEVIGELRRYLLDLLREDEIEEAQNIYEKMEEIFGLIERLDFPDSILSGIKRRRDGARSTLEKTRSDITRAVRERDLEEALKGVEDEVED